MSIAILGNDSLFERVVTILERARTNVVRAVNSEMVLAYWLSDLGAVVNVAFAVVAGSFAVVIGQWVLRRENL